MARFRVAEPDEIAIIKILADSERDFGAIGADRYEALLRATFVEVASNPMSPLSKDEGHGGVRSFHLRHCRDLVSDPPGRVHSPRHSIIYEITSDEVIDILGLIHERQSRPGAPFLHLAEDRRGD